MTDSMNFGPDWIRNLSSEGTTGGTTSTTPRYQLAEYRYGREEMLALFDKSIKPPSSITNFKGLYSEQTLLPLALVPYSEDEERTWQSRPTSLGGSTRGRGGGGSMDRGGRIGRSRGGYQGYGRSSYESGWGNGDQPDWSPRKEFSSSASRTTENWRRSRNEEEDGWRSRHEKWGRSSSWRGEGEPEERSGPPERGGRSNWHDIQRGPLSRKWDEDHLPEWATENPTEGGGTFDSSGAFHGSDDEQNENKPVKEEPGIHKSASQQHITSKPTHPPLSTSKSAISLTKPEVDKPSDSISREDALPEKPSSESIESNPFNMQNSEPPPIEQISNKNMIKENVLELQKPVEKVLMNSSIPNGPLQQDNVAVNKTEDDLEVLVKGVVDEEPGTVPPSSTYDSPGVQPPPNLPSQEKWYYQDPQGHTQGPFSNNEMAEWFKAGYFSHQLKVRRECDQRFVLLGELVVFCGADPFTTGVRFPPFKGEEQGDSAYQQFMSGFAVKQAHTQSRPVSEPWASLQHQELAAQRLQMLHQQQMSQDLPFLQQSAQQNPLMMMINKMQQANKLPGHSLLDKNPNPSASHAIDPLLVQMNNLQSLQSRLGTGAFAPGFPGAPTGLGSTGLPPGNLTSTGLSSAGLPSGLSQTGLPSGLGQAGMPSGLNQSGLPSGGIPSAGMPTSLSSAGLPSGGLPAGLGGPTSLGTGGLPSHHLQGSIPSASALPTLSGTNLQGSEGLASTLQSLQLGGSGGMPLSSLQTTLPLGTTTLPLGLPNALNVPPRPKPSAVDQIPPSTENDPITNLLKQLQQQNKQQQPLDSLWQQNQFSVPSSLTSQQWQQSPQPEVPVWEIQTSTSTVPNSIPLVNTHVDTLNTLQEKLPLPERTEDKEKKCRDEHLAKEHKKKKEAEEKQAKREAEEKKKLELKKQEIEKKAAEERKKKDEERIRKELEKHKKEAEEKRLKELEEKRRLREQRKAEEEQKKKGDEVRKQEDERIRKEQREREEAVRRQNELAMKQTQEQLLRNAKVAPWSQPNTNLGLSLSEIQKAEKEKKAQEAALQLQRQQQLQEQQNLQNQEKIGWARRPLEPSKVKSLAEIQAEEQDRLSKQAAEARLAALQKEKEIPVSNPGSIWNNQNLTWANTASNNQWSSSSGGFWEDISQKSKPSVPKSHSTSAISNAAKMLSPQSLQQLQPQQKQAKPKPKKEEQQTKANNGDNEFINWCYKTLSNISTDVDVPTFVTFLRDIESAYDVREYCKEYLGDNPATQQFASNFLEKRRSCKPKNNTHKDDMCSPAPAITPSSLVHSNEFQEVKGKNKKNKKSKMLKVDSRILGFNVTSAPDRINVGDRDYGDNS